MKERIRKAIVEAVGQVTSLGPQEIPAFTVDVPAQESFGDFASNVAMLLARKCSRPPRELAKQIVEQLKSADFLEKVEIAGPGFINFFVRTDVWRSLVKEILSQGSHFGKSESQNPERILIEFVSANPTGPLHFGHGRGAVVGDVLARLLQFSGHHVVREFYVNDAGSQVRNLALSVVARLREQHGLDTSFPKDGYRGDYVKNLALALPVELTRFLPGEPDEQALQAIQDFAVTAMLKNIQADLADFGVTMDQYASERGVIEQGRLQQVFHKLKERGTLKEQDGALWFLSDQFGDEKPRVLLKSDGSSTYFATDIAYHEDKIQRGFDRLIDIWGADHHGYIPRMKASLQALGYSPDRLEVILIQMVSLVRDGEPVIMSKREGEIIELREVVTETGRDAARFFFLLRGTDSQMEFDLELAKKRSLENPVFYAQYGHARLSSILRKARERGIAIPGPEQWKQVDLKPLEFPEEIRLIKKMSGFRDVILRAASSRTPHLLVFYLQDLIGEFHSYYTAYGRKSPILGGKPELMAARLLLVLALQQLVRNALQLLGVSAPERMEALESEDKNE